MLTLGISTIRTFGRHHHGKTVELCRFKLLEQRSRLKAKVRKKRKLAQAMNMDVTALSSFFLHASK